MSYGWHAGAAELEPERVAELLVALAQTRSECWGPGYRGFRVTDADCGPRGPPCLPGVRVQFYANKPSGLLKVLSSGRTRQSMSRWSPLLPARG